MHEVFQRPEHIPLWHDAARGRPMDWAFLYRDYTATLDWPGAAFWSPLSRRFPDALVVLSMRDSTEWFRSLDATINELMMRRPQASTRAWYAMVHDLLKSTFAPFPVGKQAAVEAYNRHNAAVQAATPPDRLVVWQPGDGWEPLCSRLGLPVPPEPFPHLNTTDDYREILDGLPGRRWRWRLQRGR